MRKRGDISEDFDYFTQNTNKDPKLSFWIDPPQDLLAFEYFKSSSLHGLKYIGQPMRHLSERIFWLIAFLIGLVVAIYLISDVWKKYKESPVIISFQPFETSIEEIPFPAITICNINKVTKTKAEEYMRAAERGEKDSVKKLSYLEHVCSSPQSFSGMFNYSYNRGRVDPSLVNEQNTSSEEEDNQEDLENFLQDVSQACAKMTLLCTFAGEIEDCTQLFRPIETAFGKCCTFNMVPRTLLFALRNDSRDSETTVNEWRKWHFEQDGILIPEHSEIKFPYRQSRAGKSFGLSVLLDPDLDEYYCTGSDSMGFRVQAHLPVDFPHVNDFGIAVRPDSEVYVSVTPDITLPHDTVESFSLNQRGCYYDTSEVELAFFHYYTPSSCLDECISNLTFKECGCVRFYMPRDTTRKLCGPLKASCADIIRKQVSQSGINDQCGHCMPTCSEVNYRTETTFVPLQGPEVLWRNKNNELAPWTIIDTKVISMTLSRAYKNVSILHVFMGQDSIYPKLRKELYGSTDLLSSTGGLMGLCLGFSGLSLMEIIYFLTLRAFCRRRRRKIDKFVRDEIMKGYGKNDQSFKLETQEDSKSSFGEFNGNDKIRDTWSRPPYPPYDELLIRNYLNYKFVNKKINPSSRVW